jgi:hypothetical protein
MRFGHLLLAVSCGAKLMNPLGENSEVECLAGRNSPTGITSIVFLGVMAIYSGASSLKFLLLHSNLT